MAVSINPPVCSRLHWEISAFTELVAQSADQKAEKADICAELQVVGRRIWGSSVFVAQHGSSMSGAALRTSDLDVVIGGLTELPKPDNPTGNGYLPGPRAVVAAELEKLMQCVYESGCTPNRVVTCGDGRSSLPHLLYVQVSVRRIRGELLLRICASCTYATTQGENAFNGC